MSSWNSSVVVTACSRHRASVQQRARGSFCLDRVWTAGVPFSSLAAVVDWGSCMTPFGVRSTGNLDVSTPGPPETDSNSLAALRIHNVVLTIKHKQLLIEKTT